MRLKMLRENRHIDQKTLAEAVGVSQPTVSDWEKGKKKISGKNLEKVANYFNISVDYLLDRSDTAAVARTGVIIPVYGRVAAGIPIQAVEDVLEYEEISYELSRTGEFFALEIKGDSMEPKFSQGDIVIVRKQPDVETGEIAIVFIGQEEATVKQVKKGADGIMLVPLNRFYEPMYFSKRQIAETPVSILGKVVELRAKF